MSIFWNAVSDSNTGDAALSIIMPDGSTHDVRGDHPNFAAVLTTLAGCVGNYDVDEAVDKIESLVNVATTISERLTHLSDRITTDGSTIYFDGDEVDSSIATYLVRAMKREGLVGGIEEVDRRDDADTNAVSWRAIVAFMEKLYTNPSKDSIEHLYTFIRRYDLTISPNGDFVAFKGLRSDYSSIHSGPGIVNGRKFKHANLDNSPGNVVEIARSYVDTVRENGCSTGLHAGTFEYASDFGRGKLVAVAINPRDVVSVPSDCEFQKLRTSRYTVLNDVPHNFRSDDRDIIWDDEDDEYDDEPICCYNCSDELDEGAEDGDLCDYCAEEENSAECENCCLTLSDTEVATTSPYIMCENCWDDYIKENEEDENDADDEEDA